MNAARGKGSPNLFQRQIRRGLDQRQKPRALLFQARAVIATHRPGDKPAFLFPRIDPVDDRADRDGKALRRRPARQATINRCDNPPP